MEVGAMQKIFPAVLIVLNLCAAVVYGWQHDVRHTLYWILAAAITATVTF